MSDYNDGRSGDSTYGAPSGQRPTPVPQQTQATPPSSSFWSQTWVKVVGIVLAVLLIFGIGAAIGAEVAERHNERDGWSSDRDGAGAGSDADATGETADQTDEGTAESDPGAGQSADEPAAGADSPAEATSEADALVAAIDAAVAEVGGLGATSIDVKRGGWEVNVLLENNREVEVFVGADGTLSVGREERADDDPVLDTAQIAGIVDAAVAAAGGGTVREITTDDSARVAFEVEVRTDNGRSVEVELAQDLTVVSVDD